MSTQISNEDIDVMTSTALNMVKAAKLNTKTEIQQFVRDNFDKIKKQSNIH